MCCTLPIMARAEDGASDRLESGLVPQLGTLVSPAGEHLADGPGGLCPPSSTDYLCRRLFSVVYTTGCLPPGKDVKAACLEALSSCYIWPQVGQFTGYWVAHPDEVSQALPDRCAEHLGRNVESSGPCRAGRLFLKVLLRTPLDEVRGQLFFGPQEPHPERVVRFLFRPLVPCFFQQISAEIEVCGQLSNVVADDLWLFEQQFSGEGVELGGSVLEAWQQSSCECSICCYHVRCFCANGLLAGTSVVPFMGYLV